jgi:hypothetical protein
MWCGSPPLRPRGRNDGRKRLFANRLLKAINTLIGRTAAVLLAGLAFDACAQAPLLIYTNNLLNGFQNRSWAACNFTNTSPVPAGHGPADGSGERLGSLNRDKRMESAVETRDGRW